MVLARNHFHIFSILFHYFGEEFEIPQKPLTDRSCWVSMDVYLTVSMSNHLLILVLTTHFFGPIDQV
jgi:hypothetical protein